MMKRLIVVIAAAIYLTAVPANAQSVYGDVNGDNTLSVADVVLSLRAILGLENLTPTGLQQADTAPVPGVGGRIYGDGILNIADVVRMLLVLVGKLPPTPTLSPLIIITKMPAFGEYGQVCGKVQNVDPKQYHIEFMIEVEGFNWWTKPYFAWPETVIEEDLTWCSSYVTGGTDENARRFAFFLVKNGANLPACGGCADISSYMSLPEVAATLVVNRERKDARIISYSGRSWVVKKSTAVPVGPGPNYFSDDEKYVWVDGEGKLHLSIAKLAENDVWISTEIYATEAMGVGTYYWVFTIPSEMDANEILGMFTWDRTSLDAFKYAFREIDFEQGRFAASTHPGSQFVVQPWWDSANIHRFKLPAGEKVVVGFTWTKDQIVFQAYRGESFPGNPENLLEYWTYAGRYVPPNGPVEPHINYWQFNGIPPADGKDRSITIDKFVFIPG